MHEMALTRNVVDIGVAEAERVGASGVRSVQLTIGYARDIVEDIFEKMFAWMARGTVAENAELTIVRVPVTVRCNKCGRVYPIDVLDDSTWPCPSCHLRDYRLNTGMEFSVNRIEVCSAEPVA